MPVLRFVLDVDGLFLFMVLVGGLVIYGIWFGLGFWTFGIIFSDYHLKSFGKNNISNILILNNS